MIKSDLSAVESDESDGQDLSADEQLQSLLRQAQSRLLEALTTGHPAALSAVIDDYARLISIEPEQPEPYLVLGYLSLELGQFDHAERLLESAIRLAPFNAHVQTLKQACQSRQKTTLNRRKRPEGSPWKTWQAP